MHYDTKPKTAHCFPTLTGNSKGMTLSGFRLTYCRHKAAKTTRMALSCAREHDLLGLSLMRYSPRIRRKKRQRCKKHWGGQYFLHLTRSSFSTTCWFNTSLSSWAGEPACPDFTAFRKAEASRRWAATCCCCCSSSKTGKP